MNFDKDLYTRCVNHYDECCKISKLLGVMKRLRLIRLQDITEHKRVMFRDSQKKWNVNDREIKRWLRYIREHDEK